MHRRTLGILFAVLFLVMLGFSILFPIEPYYVLSFGATSRTMGWLLATYSLAQFVFSPLWGRLSDRIGRKPVIMIGLAGYGAAMALFAIAGSIPFLFFARALAGVLSSATLPTAMAVVADTTGSEDRAKGMGILGAAFGLGVIFGPFFGGVLGELSLRLPFFVTAGLSGLTLLVVAAILPESLRPGIHTRKAAAVRTRWAALTRDTVALYGLAFVVTFSLAGLETAFPFLAADRLGLTQRSVGYVYAIMGLVGAAVQGGLVGRLKHILGEERMILAGLLLSATGMATIAFSQSTGLATAGLSIFAAGHGLIRPANAALISRRAPVGHGLAIGILDSMDSLGRILGPVTGGLLYARADFLPFLSGTGLNLLTLVIFLLLLLALRRQGPAPDIS